MAHVLDPSLVYWVLKMDDIHIFLLILLFVPLLPIMACLAEVMHDQTSFALRKPLLLWCTTIMILLGGLQTFLPSTEQLATIIVLPTIANSPLAEEAGGLTVDIVKMARDKVQELTKGVKK